MFRGYMYRVLVIFFIIITVGCDNDKLALFNKGSAAPLYFPSGSGIEFGVQAKKIESIPEGDSVMHVVVYDLPYKFTSIDEQVSAVLTKDGYKRSERLLPGVGANVVYQKGEDSLLFKYRVKVLEGLKYNVELTISWLE